MPVRCCGFLTCRIHTGGLGIELLNQLRFFFHSLHGWKPRSLYWPLTSSPAGPWSFVGFWARGKHPACLEIFHSFPALPYPLIIYALKHGGEGLGEVPTSPTTLPLGFDACWSSWERTGTEVWMHLVTEGSQNPTPHSRLWVAIKRTLKFGCYCLPLSMVCLPFNASSSHRNGNSHRSPLRICTSHFRIYVCEIVWVLSIPMGLGNQTNKQYIYTHTYIKNKICHLYFSYSLLEWKYWSLQLSTF